MASTGVTVADEVVHEFNEFKLKRLGDIKFIIYKIDGPKIVRDGPCGTATKFEDFVSLFNMEEPRYAVYDMNFTTNDGRPANKLVLISWAPDTAKVKAKMLYAGSKDALQQAFVGVATKVHATDFSELTEEALKEQCKKFA